MARAISFAEIENEPLPKLEQFKRDIQEIHARISFQPTMDDFRMMGEILIRAKERCPHGQWLPYLDSFKKPLRRELQLYMVLAKDKNVMHCASLTEFIRAHRAGTKAAVFERRNDQIAEALANLRGIEDAWQIHHKNNRKFKWPMAESIWTDPPWDCDEDYAWLADMAAAKLKPGGLLVVQCGSSDIGRVMAILKAKLTEVETMSIVYRHAGEPKVRFERNWRPVLVFSKGEIDWPGGVVSNTITVTQPEQKEYHAWQQPIYPFLKWIPVMTRPGDLILDPFSCSGTIPCVCKLTGKRCTATEKDKGMVAVSRKRLKETCV